MEELKKRVDFVFDGFFYFFGFIENPAGKKAKEILEDTPAEKIKADLKKINKEYRKKYNEMRKEVLCLE
ncbi:MAG: hypothetical protein JST62_06695 [Bacteroidetes bacterium]|nr:hypothetical protein [Bacteroidota bacterium]